MAISPYGPRPRRSARLIIMWVAVLVIIFILMFYLTSRDSEASNILASEGNGKGKGFEAKAKIVP
ncbi:Uu.00g067430.m01.CDS01 [Anthostomella pinea]|uniref:Uu.00g067430.m01.CDS01 n=1 Tax=Anthostomella pinea TaxID=933095 RepID=A0AAI8YNC6_9PEZI|nr:Uu.00g067430.m01.CDS01 [Anthostomella pinea]